MFFLHCNFRNSLKKINKVTKYFSKKKKEEKKLIKTKQDIARWRCVDEVDFNVVR